MSRADDSRIIELWRVQARLGIKPEDRRLPAPADAFERDIEAIRQIMDRSK